VNSEFRIPNSERRPKAEGRSEAVEPRTTRNTRKGTLNVCPDPTLLDDEIVAGRGSESGPRPTVNLEVVDGGRARVSSPRRWASPTRARRTEDRSALPKAGPLRTSGCTARLPSFSLRHPFACFAYFAVPSSGILSSARTRRGKAPRERPFVFAGFIAFLRGHLDCVLSDFGFRISFGLRISDFGLFP
jgi:hypothetical protein